MFLVGGGIMIHGLPFLGFMGGLHVPLSWLGNVAAGLVWGFVLLAVVGPLAAVIERRRKPAPRN
ncbi:MAG: hypothetical protein LBQ79_00250, partial [Deltaproteobacteria bacterium]|jgi:predicted small integral membrane protein|nr:hypothetical protein [Deltaproteobacteria bacterium]